MGYIYLIEEINDNDTKYKIGYTKNAIYKRIGTFKTGNPDKLKEVYKYETRFDRKLETAIHNFYSHRRLDGEWFNLDITEVVNFLPLCDKIENNLALLEKSKIKI